MSYLSNFFLVTGLGLFCFGIVRTYRRMIFIRYSKTNVGKVIDYERHETKFNCFYPVVEFYVSRKTKVNFKSSVASNKKRYSIGEEVPIRYIPQKPQIAEINKFWIIWLEIPLCFIFSIVLLWLGFPR